MSTRLLVCGSRTWADRDAMESFLWAWFETEVHVLIHGNGNGADRMAAEIAEDWLHISISSYPAEWFRFGKAAGHIRNQRMIDEGKPELVFAFVDKPLERSRGTADMVRRARAHDIPTFVIERVETLP